MVVEAGLQKRSAANPDDKTRLMAAMRAVNAD